jgi:hypothetical protein
MASTFSTEKGKTNSWAGPKEEEGAEKSLKGN